jgi:hypothetical protein
VVVVLVAEEAVRLLAVVAMRQVVLLPQVCKLLLMVGRSLTFRRRLTQM